MKDPGFAEEEEWRLLFVPPRAGVSCVVDFHPRRDFLAPYIKLRDVWAQLRPEMMRIDELAATVPLARADAQEPPKLVPITKIMIGPSGDKSLNERAFAKAVKQAGREVEILTSKIPYRSVA